MKKFVFIFVACFISLATFADSACSDSLCVIQPNGDTLWTYLHGNEFYHWRSTIDGHVIMLDSTNYFRYAIVDADSLRPSNIIAHNMEDRNVFEQEFIDESSELVEQVVQFETQNAYGAVEQNVTIMSPAHPATTGDKEPVVGTRKVLTILMEFKDYPFTKTRAEFESLMNQRNGVVGPNKGSVWQYYQENSYGKLEVVSTVVGPFQAISNRQYYDFKNNGSFWDWTVDIRQLVREAINHAKNEVNFSTLDGDGDGYVDCVHVIFAGEGKSSGSTNSYIWPHTSHLDAPIDEDGVKAETYIITPELYRNGEIASIGTICHEIGHVLGAPEFSNNAIGAYDIMSGGDWNNNGRTPAHHNPYTKCYIFGWDTPKTISSETKEYTASSATNGAGNIYRIDTQTEDEFFLLEHRSYNGFDQHIPNWGLLIYHAHKDLAANLNNNAIINNTHPQQLYLVNATAESNPNSNFASYGIKKSPRAFPGNQLDKTMFTSTTIPSAKAWNGSALGVNLCFIRRTTATDIKFTVNPQIQGPSQLCGTQDYYVVSNVPSRDTVEWSYSTDISESMMFPALLFNDGREGGRVTIQRGNTSQISGPIIPEDTTMQMASYGLNNHFAQFPEIELPTEPYVGTATLHVNVKGGNGQYQLEKEIVLPEFVTPSLLAQGSRFWRVNESRTLLEESCNEINSEYIKWYVRYPNAETEDEFTGRSITLTPTEMGEMTVRIVNDCGCETSNETTYTYSVYNISPLSYPNPNITPILPVNFEIERFGQTDEFYNLDLWHQTYGRVRHKVTNESNVNIPVGDLPEGWYQIVLSLDGQILDSGSVYIQH